MFNFDTMPYGATTAEADPAKATRRCARPSASLVDRQAIADAGLQGHLHAAVLVRSGRLRRRHHGAEGPVRRRQRWPGRREGRGSPQAAGVTTPVALSLQYNSDDHYGPSSGDEYALVKSQLEADGLFTVDLQSTEWVQYSEDRTADVYPAYQLGWFPDYSDADNYLTPFFLTNNFLGNHFSDAEVDQLILDQAVTTDPAERQQIIEDIQARMGELLSTVPLLQGAQVAVSGTGIDGVVLDASFKFRFAPLTK